MRTLLLLAVVFCLPNLNGNAAPASPFEDLLRHAETIWIAQISSWDGKGNVTIKCTELLRGTNNGEMTLAIDRMEPPHLPKSDAPFLLLSQSSEKSGPAIPIIGFPWDHMFNYRGWIPFAIKRDDSQSYVEYIFSHADGKWDVDTVPSGVPMALTLSHIKRLIDRFPYDSKFHY